MDRPTKKATKRKVQHHQLLDDDSVINHHIEQTTNTTTIHDGVTNTTSIHHRRRPVKKRHVSMAIINNNETPLLSTTTTTTATTTYLLPDLIPETIHHASTTSSNHKPHSTITNSVAILSNKAPEQQHQQQQLPKTTIQGHDDITSENNSMDEFEVIPSPPLFQRSVAQVFQYHHHEPQQQQQQQQHQKVTTPMVLPSTMSPSTQIMPHHHRQSVASLSYDLPPIDDDNMVASLSLKSSSLPPTESFYTEAVMTNFKNHNKILPKGNSGKNTTCLITENESSSNEDANRDTYKNRAVAALSTTTTNHDGTAFAESSSSTQLHSILLNHHITVPPPTNPMIPPALMSGKVISTKYGLAMLVVPSSDITVSDYSNIFVSPSAIPASTYSNVVSSAPPDVTVNTTTGGATTTTTTTTRFKHWLKSEDELLHFAIMKQENGPPYMWQHIAHTYFPNTRNANQCKSRWKKIDPSLIKNAFTAEEDEIILKGERDGLSWPDIAILLPGRNSDQIRFRFLNSINPQLLKNVAWTVEEDRILDQAQSELGNKWSSIASLLPGRSENDIKNHWHNRRLKVQRKLKALVAFSKRDQTLTNLRNGMYDLEHPNHETDIPLMDDDKNEA